jgi:hypothetical protein
MAIFAKIAITTVTYTPASVRLYRKPYMSPMAALDSNLMKGGCVYITSNKRDGTLFTSA